MSCQKFEYWISGYIDGELPEDERRQLEKHMAGCDDCRGELERLRTLKEELAMLKFREPSDAEIERYWRRVYNRLERGIGWILFSLGAILVLGWGAIMLLEDVLGDAHLPPAMKVGIVSLAVGAVVLFVSVVRERLTFRRGDKYSREVQR
jgi:anti-sigma factor RsiW